MERKGRRPLSTNERMLTEVMLRQMDLLRFRAERPRSNSWESWLQQLLIVTGFLVTGIGLGRLIG
jgi:hypothetical protein